jgi:hypothetical protein
MAFTAIDASSTLAPHAAALARAGIKRVGRYLSHTDAKNLTRAEALTLGRAGIGCWMVFETRAVRALDGHDAGVQDAQSALLQARAIGAPAGAGIYFAVDFDPDPNKQQPPAAVAVAGPIHQYFSGVNATLKGTGFIPGAYGLGLALSHCLDNNLVTLTWVWAATGTTGTQAFIDSGRASIRQHREVHSGSPADTLQIGVSFDPDDCNADCGAFIIDDAGARLLGAST